MQSGMPFRVGILPTENKIPLYQRRLQKRLSPLPQMQIQIPDPFISPLSPHTDDSSLLPDSAPQHPDTTTKYSNKRSPNPAIDAEYPNTEILPPLPYSSSSSSSDYRPVLAHALHRQTRSPSIYHPPTAFPTARPPTILLSPLSTPVYALQHPSPRARWMRRIRASRRSCAGA